MMIENTHTANPGTYGLVSKRDKPTLKQIKNCLFDTGIYLDTSKLLR